MLKSISTRLFSGVALLLCLVTTTARGADQPPAMGEVAADFQLDSLRGKTIKISEALVHGPAVLVVLRGYPGYQCPLCTKQFAEFRGEAAKFKAAGVPVLFVYPGPSEKLKQRANEFLKGKACPDNYEILLDPDYTFTDSYGLRWNADGETAYPSTFVLDANRKILFAKVSKEHSNRAKADEVLKVAVANKPTTQPS